MATFCTFVDKWLECLIIGIYRKKMRRTKKGVQQHLKTSSRWVWGWKCFFLEIARYLTQLKSGCSKTWLWICFGEWKRKKFNSWKNIPATRENTTTFKALKLKKRFCRLLFYGHEFSSRLCFEEASWVLKWCQEFVRLSFCVLWILLLLVTKVSAHRPQNIMKN